MFKKILIFLQAVLLFSLSAGSGIAADTPQQKARTAELSAVTPREKALASFITALLEKNPEKQCLLLLDVVKADPENAEIPLAAFKNSFKKVKKSAAVLDKFNKIWSEFPDNTFIVLHGAEVNRISLTSPQKRLQQLKPVLSISPAALIRRPGWDSVCTITLIHNAAAAIMGSRDYRGLVPLFRSWSKTPVPHNIHVCTALARFCYTASARSYCRGDMKTAADLEKCFNDAVLCLKKAESSVTSEKEALTIVLFYSTFRKLLNSDQLRFASAYRNRVRSHQADTLLLSAAVESGNIERFNEAADSIAKRLPRFDATELRFKTFLNAGNFAAAEAELKRMPQKYHFELRRQYLYKKQDWRGLYDMVSAYLAKGGAPDTVVGLLLISTAEKLRDKNIFRQAEKILRPHRDIPSVANSIGYVGTVLGENLPECRKLIAAALKKEPENIAYLDSMAWVSFKQGKFREAEKWINMALERITPLAGVSVIFEHAGDIALALKKDPLPWYKASLKYAPFDAEFDKEAMLKKIQSVK